MKTEKSQSVEELKALFDEALGKACWHVTVGDPTLPDFSLALGEKLKRAKPLQNLQQPKLFRNNEGEVSIFVRTAWRLEQRNTVLAGSDDKLAEIKTGLNHILRRKLVGAIITEPAWDLSLEFSNGLRLKIFCERTAHRSSSRRNHSIRLLQTGLSKRPCPRPGAPVPPR